MVKIIKYKSKTNLRFIAGLQHGAWILQS